jgi:hypothetical protein
MSIVPKILFVILFVIFLTIDLKGYSNFVLHPRHVLLFEAQI